MNHFEPFDDEDDRDQGAPEWLGIAVILLTFGAGILVGLWVQ